jgi:hypothetical protein
MRNRVVAWSANKLNLKWYECFWAMLPVGLSVVGGALGGICGGVALACNIALMRSSRAAWQRYLATGVISVAALGAYLVSVKAVFVVVGPGTVASLRVDETLKRSPLLVAIQKADHAAYDKIRDTMIEIANQGKPDAEILRSASPLIGMITKRYLPVASDQAVVNFTRILTLEVDQIGAKNVDACFDFVFAPPGASSVNIETFVTPEVLQQDIAASSAVVDSGAAAPQPIPEKNQIAEALNEVVRQLVTRYGADSVNALAKPATLDHRLGCVMTSQLYKEALSLPAASSVPLLRFLYRGSANI